MTYRIRPFETGDAPGLAALTLDAIRGIGAKAYSPEQIEVWSLGHIKAERFIARAEAGEHIYVMVPDAGTEAGEPAAYALLEPDGHLDMLYCSPAHSGRGLAARLLDHAESEAREMGVTKLYTEASELACSAFERAGYKLVERCDFEVRGVSIHNYAMEKSLV